MRITSLLFGAALMCQATCRQPTWAGAPVQKIAGVTVVAPPKPIDAVPFQELAQLDADWVAIIPYAFTRPTEPKVYYNTGGHQWWGERPEGVATTIQLAHAAGLKVMLKPQVWIMGKYTGDLSWSSTTDWATWEADYLHYLLPMATTADSLGVEMLCIGTEWKNAVKERPQFWSNIIDSVRKVYQGKLTYAANWDDYDDVPFWNKLDYIGVNAYWPLAKTKTPTIDELAKAWQPFVNELGSFAANQQKPVLFTEYGYLSVDSCAWRTWEREGQLESIARNDSAQAQAIDAIWQSFSGQPWWAGGFLWKWFPNGMGHEGYPEKDYSPQGKAGEDVLRHWFGKLKS